MFCLFKIWFKNGLKLAFQSSKVCDVFIIDFRLLGKDVKAKKPAPKKATAEKKDGAASKAAPAKKAPAGRVQKALKVQKKVRKKESF